MRRLRCFSSQLWNNEDGMIYPHLLIMLILAAAVSASAASAAVSYTQTAENLTEYYELRIIELMALRHFAEHMETSEYSFSTNKGSTTVTVSEVAPDQQRIQITTALPNRSFSASFYYNKEQKFITTRVEHQ